MRAYRQQKASRKLSVLLSPNTLFLGLIFVALVAIPAYCWLNTRRWRLGRIIRSGNPQQIEAARDQVTKQVVPYLMRKYWREHDWPKKRAIVELLQDQYHPDLPKLMLDFLRVPFDPSDEQTRGAQAIALGFVDERYDRFMDYINNPDLLARDVRAVLSAHGLQAEPFRPPKPQARPAFEISPSASPSRCLLLGVALNNISAVEKALNDGADINAVVKGGEYYGCSALVLSALLGHCDIAKLLIERGADIHFARCDLKGEFHPRRGQTALWWAANHGCLPLAKELIRRGANIDAPDHFGGTPLITAAGSGHLEMVRYLVSQGADIHARLTTLTGGASDGRTAFHLAVGKGHLPVAEFLLEAGNDPNEPDGFGYTPLMVAVQNNYYDMANWLISEGADVNAVHGGFGTHIGLRGWTPLVFSVSGGLLRMTQMLIQRGADIHYRVPAGRNWDGKPLPERGLLDFATGRRSESITKLLRENGLS